MTHEFGHYYFAKKFNFEIEKVEIFPFGAFLSLNDYGTHHIIEELVIVMAGPSTHLGMHSNKSICIANIYWQLTN